MSFERALGQPHKIPSTARAKPALRPLSLRRNFAWTLVGNAVYSGAQGAVLVLLGWAGGPEMQGRFAMGLALCAPVVMFANMQLRLVQATDARNGYVFGDYLSLRLASSGLAYAVIAALVLLSHYRVEVAAVFLLIGGAKVSESISDIIWGLWQKQERLDLMAISMMIKGAVSVAVVAAVLAATRSLLWATGALAAAWTGLLLSYDAFFARRVLRQFPPDPPRSAGASRPLRGLAWVALPLGVVGLLDSLNANVPRYLIERHLGEAALGYFALFAYLMVVGNTIVAALAQSASARLSRHFVTDREAFVLLTWRLIAFGLLLGGAGVLAAALLGRPLLSLLGPGYAAQMGPLLWLMLAAALGYVARFVVISANAARAFRAQAPLYAVALAVVAACSWWMIPRWGLVGAAWAVLVAMAALLLGAGLILWQALRRASEVIAPARLTPQLGVTDGG